LQLVRHVLVVTAAGFDAMHLSNAALQASVPAGGVDEPLGAAVLEDDAAGVVGEVDCFVLSSSSSPLLVDDLDDFDAAGSGELHPMRAAMAVSAATTTGAYGDFMTAYICNRWTKSRSWQITRSAATYPRRRGGSAGIRCTIVDLAWSGSGRPGCAVDTGAR
jgi:hypothetical protein